MTVSIEVENVSLEYRVPKKLSLSLKRTSQATGGIIQDKGQGKRVVQALSDISFSLNPGDRLGLIGSNGAGKTTLLKVLYGVYKPTSGSLRVNGRVDALFNIRLGFRPEASGRRNIVLRGLINGWTEADINKRMDEIIEFSELGEFIELPLKTYSQGMAARLAFAVATTMDPEILLMDEWIGAGDSSFQAKSKERMKQLAEKAGIIVLASHDKNIIHKNCNRVLELEKGRIKSYKKI
ncbi:ABC transporter ATP-binding protein [Pseudochrobactrum sp. MP213Fo]|uniref:ABC transporter ATP-binding protein n=1 Tax=Pseudochrobactrum sp. MP213Fo TaxID=3022250 RepID=UPI003B9E92A7